MALFRPASSPSRSVSYTHLDVYKRQIHSTKCEEPGAVIGMRVDPFDIHIMHKSDEPIYRDDDPSTVIDEEAVQ